MMTMSEHRGHEIAITRHFAASPARVFREWLSAEAVGDWFVPDTYEGVSAAVAARKGGAWHVEYRSPTGDTFVEHGAIIEMVPDSWLVMTLIQFRDRPMAETMIDVQFHAEGGGTRMEFRQSGFETAARRDGNAEGWEGCFAKLSRRL